MSPKIGIIGLGGEELKKDLWGTLQEFAEIGYKGIEGSRQMMDGNPKENIEKLNSIGLQVITTTADKDMMENNIESLIKTAKAVKASHATIWYGPADSKKQLIEDAKIYNKAGEILAEEGIKLCYHNHDHEFNTSFNGVRAIDILAEYTNPDYVYFEIDCAWVTYGGCDPVECLKRMKGRVPAIHIKDLKGIDYPDRKSVVFSAVGTGIVKVKETVQMAIDTGVEWIVVEQDRLRNLTAMETLTASYLNLKEMGFKL